MLAVAESQLSMLTDFMFDRELKMQQIVSVDGNVID
jgi:hypothetical protein